MTFREKGQPVYKTSLPFASVANIDQAKDLRTMLCVLAYDGRYIINGLETGGQNLSILDAAANLVENALEVLVGTGQQKST